MLATILVGCGILLGSVALADGDGSLTTPVHRIPLFDETGERISPHDKLAMPFSARNTCGRCHDYDKIASGWHFNSCDKTVASGNAGEPWVLADDKTGTQLPVSNRDWDGAWTPEEIGMTPWEFVKTFGHHMPGGGWGEVQEEGDAADARWGISGNLEVNCLGCHNASPMQNQSDWVIQIARENFRWAATSAATLGFVGGVASRLPDYWDLIDGPDPDNSFTVPPSVDYNHAMFDTQDNLMLDVTADVPADRCLFCHTTAVVGADKAHHDGDVHLAAGLTCTDCHRSKSDHNIVRGGESSCGVDTEVSTLSCRGCHYGVDGAEGEKAMGGRLGAPLPAHKGLPEEHLEELTCTACHSGLFPKDELNSVRTARANRLGVHGKAKWDTKLPMIASPVFQKTSDGKIAPHHMFWPAFWAEQNEDKLVPMLPERVATAAGEILEPEMQVARVLRAIASMDDAEAKSVYLVNGKAYELWGASAIQSAAFEAAGSEPVWALLKDGQVLPIELDSLGWTVENLTAADAALDDAKVYKILEEIDYESLAEGASVYITGGKVNRWTREGVVVEDLPAGITAADKSWGDLATVTAEGAEENAPVTYTFKAFDAETIKKVAAEMLGSEHDACRERISNRLAKISGIAPEGSLAVYLANGKCYQVDVTEDGNVLKDVEMPAGAPANTPFWGLLAEGKVNPLVPAYVTEAIGSDALTEAQINLVLAALGEDGKVAYISGGMLHARSGDSLSASEHEDAKPYAWTMGHDVRPAQQALGAGGCTDCHSKDAPFFFAEVAPVSPANVALASAVPMLKLEQFDEAKVNGWITSAKLRNPTVYIAIVLAGIIGFALLRYAFVALEAILRAIVCRGKKA